MRILITGAKGFIGKNLVADLKANPEYELMEVDVDTPFELLDTYARSCEFVMHLAGVNRPEKEEDFMTGNFGFTSELLNLLEKYKNPSPILITSSIQAERNNPYGLSKKAGEDLVFEYSKRNSVKCYVYRLTNLFGKWSRPNYNTVVATFCHNIARGLDIQINDRNTPLSLSYIDDVLTEFKRALVDQATFVGDYCKVPINYEVTLGEISDLLYAFKESRSKLTLPYLESEFSQKLYSTYLSFLEVDDFSYPLLMHTDHRGSFSEFLKTKEGGQVSVNITKPGITKGNHWHHSKNEKFLVVSGTASIKLRKIGSEEVIEYITSGDKLEVIDIPTGYTHNITNTGDTDMVLVIWANECYDPERPDTFFVEV